MTRRELPTVARAVAEDVSDRLVLRGRSCLFYLGPPCTALVAWLLLCDRAFTGLALTVFGVYLARE